MGLGRSRGNGADKHDKAELVVDERSAKSARRLSAPTRGEYFRGAGSRLPASGTSAPALGARTFVDSSSGPFEPADFGFKAVDRNFAQAVGTALETARAEEKRFTKGGGTGKRPVRALSLLQSAYESYGPAPVLDTLVPGLRTVNKRLVVVEDKDKRLDLFQGWFGNKHDLCMSKTVRGSIDHIIALRADFLFLDFDLHDAGDRTLRDWLKVSPSRRELDGLDVADYVCTLPERFRPEAVIVHSRNPVGRDLIQKRLALAGIKAVMWAFNYKWSPT